MGCGIATSVSVLILFLPFRLLERKNSFLPYLTKAEKFLIGLNNHNNWISLLMDSMIMELHLLSQVAGRLGFSSDSGDRERNCRIFCRRFCQPTSRGIWRMHNLYVVSLRKKIVAHVSFFFWFFKWLWTTASRLVDFGWVPLESEISSGLGWRRQLTASFNKHPVQWERGNRPEAMAGSFWLSLLC